MWRAWEEFIADSGLLLENWMDIDGDLWDGEAGEKQSFQGDREEGAMK